MIFTYILTVLGLAVFEIISSIDNAVINAEVLSGMSTKAKNWFLLWGLIFAVFVVRGLLPWLIVFISNPSLGLWGSLTATFSGDPSIHAAIEASSPILLAAGGVFLLFLFLHWLFMEEKHYGLGVEKFFHAQSIWFYAAASLLLCVLVWPALHINPIMGFGIVVGSSAFFITQGFKENAEKQETALISGARSDISKILFLEIIDATFSIDGVLGAFAFTLSVPLIILGNGIGAVVLRQLTVGNIENIKKYIYLKNGAMYSILFLGIIMLMDAFGHAIPEWLSPLVTFLIVGFFFVKSKIHLKKKEIHG